MENIFSKIQTHLDYLDACIKLSKSIEQSDADNVEAINSNLDNRDRLVSIVSKVQLEIESLIDGLNGAQLNPESVQIFKAWQKDVHEMVSSIIEIDALITAKLENHKKQVQSEIQTTFTNSEKFKGYNLQTVRK
ncbi:MAG: hypothetical protein COW00_06245 [Bdellovibrio sp. CG12_big_fil_rev_8_21_14_0_65_39_13]|nr:MAG: hypothetical protein COW78_18780 [Bdellovibrio sp. CG22_combo_CG10-13_8_21_14_all_39_27]PIQ60823.1 MAG: hypothetical protein COW00_06245 [Bdellovibrio sp. CG12_big_fil_rev_8_21_14_0_65_39_13]PIR36447.1 MAG: hypothetical protein COV37_03585 [Bdellovibrio sp. CG11_big_fil_rev_8_21_14_0_20_39_38]